MSRWCLSLQQPLRRVSKDPHSFLGLMWAWAYWGSHSCWVRELRLQEKRPVVIRSYLYIKRRALSSVERKWTKVVFILTIFFIRHVFCLRHNKMFFSLLCILSRLILLSHGIWMKLHVSCCAAERHSDCSDRYWWHWGCSQQEQPFKLLLFL